VPHVAYRRYRYNTACHATTFYYYYYYYYESYYYERESERDGRDRVALQRDETMATRKEEREESGERR
jgi:hypothetical protein